jgi:tetratricopeptide (TPR) repeat protein
MHKYAQKEGVMFMEERFVWRVLGIEPTKDEAELKNRYHELLRDVNPEDDPEGFKRLRQAYEAAVELARRVEKEESEERQKDEIDLWLDRVNDVYWYVNTRNDVELWKELFRDDVCIALDTALEARERFIAYLMHHVYVNWEIWKLIDREFHIIEEREALQEIFPKDFLDYAQYQIKNRNFFPYEKLEVQALDESEVCLDEYIVGYLRCKTDMDRANYENMWQRLEDLKAYEIYHPYEDVERIRLHLKENHPEDARLIAERLEEKYSDDIYIGYWAGCVYWHLEQWDSAYECWQHVVDIMPDHYTSRVGLANYYNKKQDYLKAKELVMELLEANGRDDSALDLMREVNRPLIDYYKKQANEADYRKNMVEACWCMFQNELFEQTIEELNQLDIQPGDDEYYDYVNMKGRCYLGMERYEEAVDYLLKWEAAREELVDDGSEKYQKRVSREGFIKSAIGVAYQNLKQFEPAERYLLDGINKEKDDIVRHSFMDRLALLYYDFQQYEKCIDVCTGIINEDPTYYLAYLRRQQAAFEKQDGQQVVDDYYNSIRIFPRYYKPYLLAVQVFCIYHQFEDAKKVLELAKEQDVHQEMLSFFEIRVMRNLAETEEEYHAVLELCDRLQYEVLEEENAHHQKDTQNCEKTEAELLEEDMIRDGMEKDAVVPEDLNFERILVYMDTNDWNTALSLLDKEIAQGNKNTRLYWVRADILRIRKEYRKALLEYESLRVKMPPNVDIEFNCGICLRHLGRTEDAIEAFRTALKMNPKHPRAHHELMKIYSRRFDLYELKTAYGAALKEITAQLEIVPDAYYYIERGLLYMDNYNFDHALEDYRKALELEPDNIYAYNNIGYVYQVQKRFDEAIQYYTRSIELMGEERTMLPYTNMAKCYEAMKQWDSAIDILKRALEEFEPSATVYNILQKMYRNKKDMGKVIETCDKARELKLISRSEYYNKVSYAYLSVGDFEEGRKVLVCWNNWSGALRDDSHARWQACFESIEAWGVYYLYHRELKRAIRYLEDAWKLGRKHGLDYERTGIHLSNAYYMSRQWAKARTVAKETMNRLLTGNHIPAKLKEAETENPETVKYYLSYRPLAPLRMFEIAQLYISLGELDKAQQLLRQCQKVPRCRHCEQSACGDAYMIQAFIEELRGNIAEAIRLYEVAQEISPSDIEPILALDALRNRKGERNDSRN